MNLSTRQKAILFDLIKKKVESYEIEILDKRDHEEGFDTVPPSSFTSWCESLASN